MNSAVKGISIREAISKWEERTGLKASEEKKIELFASIPPIDKLDSSLTTLTSCEQLSLSTNCIEKITNMNGLKNLKILSLGRNNIKSLVGLEAVGDSLEELWISYNQVEKLKGINALKKLKVLYMSNNLLKDWAEFQKLADLPLLENLLLIGNPLEEKHSQDGDWKEQVAMRLKKLKKLDGAPVIREDEQEDNVE